MTNKKQNFKVIKENGIMSIFDKNNNKIYYENSIGYWEKGKFDKNNNEVYWKNSEGYWVKSKFDKNNNEIYYEKSTGYWVKRKFDKNNNKIYWEDSDGFWIKSKFDKNNNEIYWEDSDGFWIKSKFDKNNNKIYYETSGGDKWEKPKEKIKPKPNKEIIIIWFLIVCAFIFGFLIGIIFQQIIIIEAVSEAGESWEGVISNLDIEVNLNETKLVEETYKMFPELRKGVGS